MGFVLLLSILMVKVADAFVFVPQRAELKMLG